MTDKTRRENLGFDDWLAAEMQDPEFRRAYESLEPAYQVARLRLKQGLSQRELAERAGTQQPHIARLESGHSTPSLSFLRRVASAMGGSVQIIIRDPAGRPVADVSDLCERAGHEAFRLRQTRETETMARADHLFARMKERNAGYSDEEVEADLRAADDETRNA